MPLTVAEVASLVVASARPVGTERVALRDALDRVLRADAVSGVALPPWDNASMDGYAVRRADLAAAPPIVLPVTATIAAGTQAPHPLAPGTAMRIMTGAPAPAGADSVIRVEDTDGGVDRVTIRDARDAGRNVRPRGEDIAVGRVVVEAGTVLGPAHLGVLASIGAATVEVSRRPRIALMATGDEIVDIDRFDEVLAGRRIVSSNSYGLRASLERAGADVVELGIGADDPGALRARLERGLDCDAIVTTGGVSVGTFDHTRTVVRALGGTIAVDRVRMRPGAPLGFGTIGSALWLGLPGNPVSALVTFELFGRPLVRRLRGETAVHPVPIPCVMDEPITITGALTHFLRGVVSGGPDGRLHARLTGGQGSGMLTSVSRSNALLVVAAERQTVNAGETVPAILPGAPGLLAPTCSFA